MTDYAQIFVALMIVDVALTCFNLIILAVVLKAYSEVLKVIALTRGSRLGE